jgi:chromate transport protein ChrA
MAEQAAPPHVGAFLPSDSRKAAETCGTICCMPPPRPGIGPFVRASALHIGAAAATASLRDELIRDERATAHDVDAAYAVSRVTPGTNLLALYALLGHRLGGWPLALSAVAVGVLMPGVVAVILVALYTHASTGFVSALMTGARAGGVAVFLGAAIRLLKPQLPAHPGRGLAFAALAVLVAPMRPLSLFAVLLVAGAAGAFLLKPR